MSTEHHITIARTARYYILGELNSQTRNVWFVLHGYGQLAKYFIKKFDVIVDSQTVIVAPEGLSRLYLDAEYGRVGASWMTREDREYEVSDYLAYLNQLYDSVLRDVDTTQLTITLMGFSQGCATACRWLNAGHIRCDRMQLWAGYFPNGLTDVIDPAKLSNLPISYIYGRQDEYIEQMPDPEGYIQRLQAEIPHMQLVPFDGKHVVEREVLRTSLSTNANP